MKLFACNGLRWPLFFCNPATRPLRIPAFRPYRIHQIAAIGRIILNAGLNVLKPSIPPAQSLLEKADTRPRHCEMRVFMHPRPYNTFYRCSNSRHQSGHRILVSVAPAPDCKCRGPYLRKILANGATLPIGIACLVVQPNRWQKWLVVQALEPHTPPFFTNQGRIRRPGRIGQHRCAPTQIFIQREDRPYSEYRRHNDHRSNKA